MTLIGANGAGKSTTLRSINGLNHPSTGAIRFMGEDITRTPAHEIVRMGISQSPEGRKLFPRMTVVENLEMGAFQRRTARRSRRTWSTSSHSSRGSQSAERRRPGTMSGGEQQMCAIGRAMMARPKLLMLDEPSMGLAPIFVERIFETIVAINKEGTPILLVEQNALMALDVAQPRVRDARPVSIVLEGPASRSQDERGGQKDLPGRGLESHGLERALCAGLARRPRHRRSSDRMSPSASAGDTVVV